LNGPVQVYLIRHPAPLDVEGLCYGRLDVAVEPGAIRATAQSLSVQISRQTLESAAIYCSPSSRCVGLARHIASPREPVPAEELMEMYFGHWQGRRWDDIPRNEIDAWAKDVWNYRPGGGESAEMVAQRWEHWVRDVRRTHAGEIIVVTHAGLIRVALARAGRITGAQALGAHIPFGSIHRLDLG
jgi:alpha-ribazole phosphatase